MYAQCPECLTVFSLDAEALAQARGEVTCGYCSGSFDALTSLTGQLPPEPFDRLPPRSITGQMPRLELAVYRPLLQEVTVLIDAEPADAPVPIEPDPPLIDAPDRSDVSVAAHAPESEPPNDPNKPHQAGTDAFAPLAFSSRFARGRRSRRPAPAPPRARAQQTRRWPWIAVCVLLLLALGAQLAWAKRDVLISDPHVGGWLRDTCATLGCRLPLVRDVHQLHLLARDVRTRPGPNGALAISATMRNDAPFAQPWPVVALTLADAHGKPVAMRRLRPSEYLTDRAVLRAGLAPGGTAALLFEVRDPGTAAALFQFAFE